MLGGGEKLKKLTVDVILRLIGRGLSLHVDCVVNEIEKRKQSHSNPKVDFSKKAKIYNTPCHLM